MVGRGGRYDPYEKVHDSDLEEHTGSDEDLLTHELPVVRKPRLSTSILSHVVAAIAGATLCFLLLEWSGRQSQETCTDVKLRRSSIVPEELTRYSETVRYNGTLDFPSIYRGTWEEVNDAWNELTEVGFVDADITDEDIKELGVDPETIARFTEKDGGGYPITIEYTHQLHCLDLLRRVNPWNYPEYMKEEVELNGHKAHSEHSDEMFKTHVDHCTEMLRQILMCHADTTPIFEQWVSVRVHPWPNFNTVHQCRNFDAIHKWVRAHANNDVEWPTRPENAKALLLPP